MKYVISTMAAVRRADDLLSVLAGCACLSIAGFMTSPRCGLVVLGACLVAIPLVFSFILPLSFRRKDS